MKKILVLASIIGLLAVGCNIVEKSENKMETSTKNSVSPKSEGSSKTSSEITINNILPIDSTITLTKNTKIPVIWNVLNIPSSATVYLDLLTADGSESLGRISNSSDCSKGGDAIALSSSTTSFNWDGLLVCSNWQSRNVNPGIYKIGVQVYSEDGTKVIASSQSLLPFKIAK